MEFLFFVLVVGSIIGFINLHGRVRLLEKKFEHDAALMVREKGRS